MAEGCILGLYQERMDRPDESCTTADRDLSTLPRRLRLAVSGVPALACVTLPGQGGCGRCRQGGNRTAPAVLAKRVGAGSRTACRRSSTDAAACPALSRAGC